MLRLQHTLMRVIITSLDDDKLAVSYKKRYGFKIIENIKI